MCGPQIQDDLKTHSIEVYPQKSFDEDVNDKILNSKIRVGGHLRWGGWWDCVWVMHCPFILFFSFILYNIVLVLTNIEMNPPQVYMCFPS